MTLSAGQLAKLRALGRAEHELELRHQARRAAVATQRDYLATLKRQLEKLPKLRDAELRDIPESRADAHEIVKRHNAEIQRLQAEIVAAAAEFEQLHEQLTTIATVSAPLRTLLDRMLRYANLSRASAGLNFGAEDRGPPGERITLNARAS